jgi:hypothetical protein
MTNALSIFYPTNCLRGNTTSLPLEYKSFSERSTQTEIWLKSKIYFYPSWCIFNDNTETCVQVASTAAPTKKTDGTIVLFLQQFDLILILAEGSVSLLVEMQCSLLSPHSAPAASHQMNTSPHLHLPSIDTMLKTS